jgi:hypothetical protein
MMSDDTHPLDERAGQRDKEDEPACKPDSVSGGHPSRATVAGDLERPTRRLGRAALQRLRGCGHRSVRTLLGLAPGGVYRAVRVTPDAGGLLHHRFTLTRTPGANIACRGPLAVCSLWHCPAGHPGWVLPTTLPCGVRTFLGERYRAARPTSRRGRPAGSSRTKRSDPAMQLFRPARSAPVVAARRPRPTVGPPGCRAGDRARRRGPRSAGPGAGRCHGSCVRPPR